MNAVKAFPAGVLGSSAVRAKTKYLTVERREGKEERMKRDYAEKEKNYQELLLRHMLIKLTYQLATPPLVIHIFSPLRIH